MKRFIIYHRHHCLNVICPFQYRDGVKQQKISQKIQDKQAIRLFSFFTQKQISKFKDRSQKFRKLQIFSLISATRMAKFLDPNVFLYRRELNRIKNQKHNSKSNYDILSTLFQTKIKQAKEILRKCTAKIYVFFISLQSEKINCETIVNLHTDIRGFEQQLLEFQNDNEHLSSVVRAQINCIFQLFFQRKEQLLPKKTDPNYIMNLPTDGQMLFLICAEVQSKDLQGLKCDKSSFEIFILSQRSYTLKQNQ